MPTGPLRVQSPQYALPLVELVRVVKINSLEMQRYLASFGQLRFVRDLTNGFVFAFTECVCSCVFWHSAFDRPSRPWDFAQDFARWLCDGRKNETLGFVE